MSSINIQPIGFIIIIISLTSDRGKTRITSLIVLSSCHPNQPARGEHIPLLRVLYSFITPADFHMRATLSRNRVYRSGKHIAVGFRDVHRSVSNAEPHV